MKTQSQIFAKNLIAVGVATACSAMIGQAFALSLNEPDVEAGTNKYENQGPTVQDGESFKAIGGWANLFVVDKGQTVTVSGYKDFTVTLDNKKNTENSVNVLTAKEGGTLNLENIGTLSITTKGVDVKDNKGNNPLPIHAYGGNININASGDITLDAQNGNALFVQATDTDNGKSASATITTEGNFTAIARGGAVLTGLLQKNLVSSKLEINAQNIDIQSKNGDGVTIYDQDATWNPVNPNDGEASIHMTAKGVLSVTGKRFGVFQTRKTDQKISGSDSTFVAGEKIEIKADSGAVAVHANAEGINNVLTFDAPQISLSSEGAWVEAKKTDGTTVQVPYATLQANQNGTVNFESSTGTAHVNITANNGNAVKIDDGGKVAANNAEINVTKGNIVSGTEGTGVLSLENSSLELASGVTASLGMVEGSNATIIVNDLAKDTVYAKTNETNLKVLASSDLTATLGADAVAEKITKAAKVENSKEGASFILGGKGTGLTSDYTVDGQTGAVTYDNGGNAESAVLSSAKHFNAANLSQWRYEVNHLSERLGDVRNQTGAIGTWARVYGMDAKVSDSVQTKLRANTIQVGADVKVGDNWIVGAAFGYTDFDSDFNNGSATADGYTLSAYGTAFFPCGAYVDLIGRVGRISSDVGLNASKASYDNTTFGLSAEVGYKWDVNDIFYVTPQAELSYGFVAGDNYAMTHDQGTVYVEQDNFTSLLGRVGVQLGANFPEKAGQIYLTASVNHDFKGETKADTYQGVERRHIEEDLGGTWFSYGVGAQFNVNDNWSFYGSLTRANGSDYQENYRYSVGTVLRW